MELWRQCAVWLIDCRVLPDNHRVTWEGAQVNQLCPTNSHTCTWTHTHTLSLLGPLGLILCVYVLFQVCDLAQALRDGVLLCQLLNNLLHQAVNLREINLRPQMSQVTHTHTHTHTHTFSYSISINHFHSDQKAALNPWGCMIRKYCDLYLFMSGESMCREWREWWLSRKLLLFNHKGFH